MVFANLIVVCAFFISTGVTKGDLKTHECARPCSEEPSLKKLCRYEFFVREASGVRRDWHNSTGATSKCETEIHGKNYLLINGKSPGPAIEVCLGDTIEVLLYNRLAGDEVSLHWHGIRQKGSVHMDGVSMVTQCPVLPYSKFRYEIRPETVGTYFYHAHSVSQQGDGLYGSLTVRGPRDDPTLERMLLLSSRPPTPLTRHLHQSPPTPSELLINGQPHKTVLPVAHGHRYLLHIVNANAYNCPVLLSATGHTFKTLAADGSPVRSVTVRHVVLFPGTSS